MFMARLLSRLSLVGTNQVYRTWSRCRYPIRRLARCEGVKILYLNHRGTETQRKGLLISSLCVSAMKMNVPQSKVLRTFSCTVASRRLMGICGESEFCLSPFAF